jgi:ATP-binding cassette, subfamily B (MDR/TAP), member 1
LRISAALRLAYLQALFGQEVSTIDSISVGKVSTRITTSSNTIQNAVSQHLALLVQAWSLTIGLYIVSFVYNWILTFVASAAVPFIVLSYGLTVPIYVKIHKRTEEMQEQATSLAFEVFSSIRVVIAFGAEERLTSQHNGWLLKAKQNENRNAPFIGIMSFPSLFAMYGTFGLCFWFGIRQYVRGNVKDLDTIVV